MNFRHLSILLLQKNSKMAKTLLQNNTKLAKTHIVNFSDLFPFCS
jgi:hypothetical protein